MWNILFYELNVLNLDEVYLIVFMLCYVLFYKFWLKDFLENVDGVIDSGEVMFELFMLVLVLLCFKMGIKFEFNKCV